MTMLTGRLKKRIEDCNLPDKVLLQAIAFAESGGLSQSQQEAPADSEATPEPETQPVPETPPAESVGAMGTKPRRGRGYNRRDMRAE